MPPPQSARQRLGIVIDCRRRRTAGASIDKRYHRVSKVAAGQQTIIESLDHDAPVFDLEAGIAEELTIRLDYTRDREFPDLGENPERLNGNDLSNKDRLVGGTQDERNGLRRLRGVVFGKKTYQDVCINAQHGYARRLLSVLRQEHRPSPGQSLPGPPAASPISRRVRR